MAQEISRRNIAKGAAWSVPAIAIASPAVAAATSACTPEKKRIIDEAFSCICLMAYWTEPSLGLANGCDKVPSFNVINLSRYEVNASVKNPLNDSLRGHPHLSHWQRTQRPGRAHHQLGLH